MKILFFLLLFVSFAYGADTTRVPVARGGVPKSFTDDSLKILRTDGHNGSTWQFVSGGSLSDTSVTYRKIQHSGIANVLLGDTSKYSNVVPIKLGTGLTFSHDTLNAAGGSSLDTTKTYHWLAPQIYQQNNILTEDSIAGIDIYGYTDIVDSNFSTTVYSPSLRFTSREQDADFAWHKVWWALSSNNDAGSSPLQSTLQLSQFVDGIQQTGQGFSFSDGSFDIATNRGNVQIVADSVSCYLTFNAKNTTGLTIAAPGVGGQLGSLIFTRSSGAIYTFELSNTFTNGTVFMLPSNNGTSGYFLKTDGSGVTSWANAATGANWISTTSLGGTTTPTAGMYAKDNAITATGSIASAGTITSQFGNFSIGHTGSSGVYTITLPNSFTNGWVTASINSSGLLAATCDVFFSGNTITVTTYLVATGVATDESFNFIFIGRP
jgi:hypothetical protein